MFGQVVLAHRRRLALTQEQLASRAGLSVRMVRNLESGRARNPQPSSVHLLADALGLQGAERDEFFNLAAGTQLQPDADLAVALNTGWERVPAQVPTDVSAFTGRTKELEELDGLLEAAESTLEAQMIPVVSGTAGVGKTALTVHWAHRMRNRFPDGQMYVDLHGFAPAGELADPAEVIRRFLHALGVPSQRIPDDLESLTALYRTLLADKKMLILLDNARHSDQVRPLLAGAPASFTLITSRNRLAGLVAAPGAHPIAIDLMTTDEAHQLLARRLGAQRVTAESTAVDQIVDQCARLPLALTVVAARAVTRPQRSLGAQAADLADTQNRLDALTTAESTTDIRAAFAASCSALDTAAARLFRLLGLHEGAEISAAAAASLAGLPMPQVKMLLGELIDASLVDEHRPDRYALHALLRVYALELANTTESHAERHAAVHRLFDHYLHTAHAAASLINFTREPIKLQPLRPGVVLTSLPDHSAAMAWFSVERSVLLAMVEQVAAAGFHAHAWQLAWTLADFFEWRGYWRDQVAAQQTALAAASRLEDRTAQRLAHRLLARAYRRLGDDGDADILVQHAGDLSRQRDEPIEQAHTALSTMWCR